MSMFEQATVSNQDAAKFLNNLRMKECGYAKVYTTKYMRAIASVCGYEVTDYNRAIILGPRNKTTKVFKSPRECGQWIESTINDLFALGIMKQA